MLVVIYIKPLVGVYLCLCCLAPTVGFVLHWWSEQLLQSQYFSQQCADPEHLLVLHKRIISIPSLSRDPTQKTRLLSTENPS